MEAEAVGHARRIVAAHARRAAPAEGRAPEVEGLATLLLEGRSGDDPLTEPLAVAIATACIEDGHLWRALALPDRGALRLLLQRWFGPLAQGNTADMRWKKYLYKRMCGWEGMGH